MKSAKKIRSSRALEANMPDREGWVCLSIKCALRDNHFERRQNITSFTLSSKNKTVNGSKRYDFTIRNLRTKEERPVVVHYKWTNSYYSSNSEWSRMAIIGNRRYLCVTCLVRTRKHPDFLLKIHLILYSICTFCRRALGAGVLLVNLRSGHRGLYVCQVVAESYFLVFLVFLLSCLELTAKLSATKLSQRFRLEFLPKFIFCIKSISLRRLILISFEQMIWFWLKASLLHKS